MELAARSTRIRRTMVSAGKTILAKLATTPLGGPVSWGAALVQGIYEFFGPNYTIAISLVANIGLIRQKYEQLDRDRITDQATEDEVAALL